MYEIWYLGWDVFFRSSFPLRGICIDLLEEVGLMMILRMWGLLVCSWRGPEVPFFTRIFSAGIWQSGFMIIYICFDNEGKTWHLNIYMINLHWENCDMSYNYSRRHWVTNYIKRKILMSLQAILFPPFVPRHTPTHRPAQCALRTIKSGIKAQGSFLKSISSRTILHKPSPWKS